MSVRWTAAGVMALALLALCGADTLAEQPLQRRNASAAMLFNMQTGAPYWMDMHSGAKTRRFVSVAFCTVMIEVRQAHS